MSENEKKHTELPYSYEYDNRGNGSFHEWYNILGAGNIIGQMETEQGAEFIVRACNSHYDLLEALGHLCKAVRPYIMQLKVKKGYHELVALAGAEKAIRKATKQED